LAIVTRNSSNFWQRHYVGTERSSLRQRFDEQFLVGSRYMRIAVRDRLPMAFRPKRLARLTMPLLVVFADHDIVSDGPAAAEKAGQRLPAARVELLADSGHFVIFDRLPAVAELLTEFLGATASTPTSETDSA
jgi:pimeloyl-ACP methyl ester carboxylesterase